MPRPAAPARSRPETARAPDAPVAARSAGGARRAAPRGTRARSCGQRTRLADVATRRHTPGDGTGSDVLSQALGDETTWPHRTAWVCRVIAGNRDPSGTPIRC